LAGWLLGRLKAGGPTRSRLELVERIALAPRQSLALVEAEGRRFLVATSPEGAPTFYALDERSNLARPRPFADRQTAPARAGCEGLMVASWAALSLAAPASVPLLPDLNARLHPSDSTPWTILLVLTLITLLPAILMCVTPMVRLLVVFHFLRQALGTQTAPSNPTLMGLALMMTWFLMAPVLNQVDQQAVEPYRGGQITGMEAIDRGAQPVKQFLLRYAREKDLALFTAAGQIPRPNKPDDMPMRVVMPAYILSELKAGFAIGAVLFLPFLLIDMVTAAITTSIGMFQLPPVVVSTPLKILLFVMVDGWNLLANSLLKSF
jgi:flagellar biosynthetic protein FliP